MRIGRGTAIHRATAVALSTGWVLLGACGDDPYHIDWVEAADTLDLYSIENPRPGLYNAFDFVNLNPVVIEALGATGNWDVAVSGDATGLTLLPTGALEVESTAGIRKVSGRLEDVRRAPQDSTEYERTAAVPVELGATYVIRTRRHVDAFGETTCVFYAKMEPIVVDLAALRVRFIYGSNPNCGDTSLEP